MTFLKKAQGGSQIGAYTWEKDGDVVDVEEVTATALLAIPGADFTVVTGTEAPAATETPAATDEAPADAAKDEQGDAAKADEKPAHEKPADESA
jgi:hypothetical protein